MNENTASYVGHANDTIEQGCAHCEWSTVSGSYPQAIESYHHHLRAAHPKAWVRS